ncbi:MAG: 1-acyl-sn-glycerol-3-phosphate acyltransferase [Prolixibacteraceae bacterium]|nr:1-acyl-sn-glycerol-3-phosphate acyltransferase [Prolixibacteraceae bacterium]
MIEARHHWFFSRFFNWYTSFMITKDFHEVVIDGDWKPANCGTMVIGNHISWWDGFWALYLNNQFLKKDFNVMMLEEQLSQRMFLNKAGAYSIQPGTRDVFKSLQYTKNLLRNAQNMVLMFPQGEISSMVNHQISFEKGVERLLDPEMKIQLLFYCAFVDYFSHRKPSLFFYLCEVEKPDLSAAGLLKQYGAFYAESKDKQAKLRE